MQGSSATSGDAASRRKRRLGLLGNVFLGIAVGLGGYYVVTGVLASLSQRSLESQLPAAVRSVASRPDSVVASPTMDFESWSAEDRRWWRSRRDGQALGRLVISDIGVDVAVVKGTSRSDLQKGPGWITYTDIPGPSGNCGISGHRTTYGAPFRGLDRLRSGDTIEFYSPYRRYTYRVRRVFAVAPDQVEVVGHTESPTLTLTACHPPYSARQRLIVQSDLVEVRRIPAADDSR